MMKIVRTNSKNIDFKNLVLELDAYLKITDGDEHTFYNQYNTINLLKNVVVIYINEIAVGCGAIKKFDETSMEIKRMYVSLEKRGTGIAQKVIIELEKWAKELGYKKCILETGKRQLEAVKFYQKCNYKTIDNYAQYIGMDNSICFEKKL